MGSLSASAASRGTDQCLIKKKKKIHTGLLVLPGGRGWLMISLLPGSQASEIDACVSLQLVKETGTETLCAYKQVAVCR